MLRTASSSIALVLALLLLGCTPGDPLDAIRQQQASGDYAGSIETLRALLLEEPKNPEANYLYGRALVLTGQHSLATWSLLAAMDDPDWLVPAAMQLAHAYLASHNFNEAVAVTTRVLEQHPEDTQALLFRAQAHAHWKAHPEKALADAERALELEPDLLEAYEPRILALLGLQRQEEAIAVLAEAGERLAEIETTTENVLAWHCSTTAVFAVDAGELDRARQTWRGCLEKYPAVPVTVLGAVEFYDGQRDLDRSVQVLRNALAEQPEQRGFRTMLAERLRATGEPAEGEALLREATEVHDPRHAATAWSDLALYLHALKEHAAAAEALAQSIARIREVEEPSPQLLFRYADALLLSGQLEKALVAADDVPVAAQRRLIRARVLQEQGDPVAALAEFDEAIRLWPDNAAARYYAAREAEKLGDFDRALEEYRASIRAGVGATNARTRAARLLIAQGQLDAAYQLLFLQVAENPLEPEGERLGVYLMARVANPQQLQDTLTGIGARTPARLPEALARAADGAAELAGPSAALSLLIGAPGVDYEDPTAAPVLRALVHYARGAGRDSVAKNLIDAALASRPGAASFHEARGLYLERIDEDPAAARAAYARAVEIDPSSAVALAGLGRFISRSDRAAAVAWFDRAAAADETEPAYPLAAARALIAGGQTDEAIRRLDALLLSHPLSDEAAAELVRIDLERDAVTERTLERAERAARFGPSIRDYEQLRAVYERVGRPERAAEAERRAEFLRRRRAQSQDGG